MSKEYVSYAAFRDLVDVERNGSSIEQEEIVNEKVRGIEPRDPRACGSENSDFHSDLHREKVFSKGLRF